MKLFISVLITLFVVSTSYGQLKINPKYTASFKKIELVDVSNPKEAVEDVKVPYNGQKLDGVSIDFLFHNERDTRDYIEDTFDDLGGELSKFTKQQATCMDCPLPGSSKKADYVVEVFKNSNRTTTVTVALLEDNQNNLDRAANVIIAAATDAQMEGLKEFSEEIEDELVDIQEEIEDENEDMKEMKEQKMNHKKSLEIVTELLDQSEQVLKDAERRF